MKFRLIRLALLAVFLLAAANLKVAAQPYPVVRLEDDPYRHLVLANGKIRVWDVVIPVGESTPFHDHRTDSLTVVINSTEISNVIEGGTATDTRMWPGTTFFTENSRSPYPYVHRIAVKGPNPHRVIEVDFRGAPEESDGVTKPSSDEWIHELLARNQRQGFKPIPISPNPPMRAFIFVLEAAQSTDRVAPGKNTLVIVVTGGPVTVQSADRDSDLRQLALGGVLWQEEASRLVFKNEAGNPTQLLEIEVK
jgi:hypothetical protein